MELFIIFCIGIITIGLLWNKPKLLICILLLYVCTVELLISEFGIPSAAKYVADLLNIYIFVWAVLLSRKSNLQKLLDPQILIVIGFICVTIISFLFNRQGVLLYLWGLRNIVRFFMFFFSCKIILSNNDVKMILSTLSIVFFLNAALVTYQYFILGLRMDYISGSFGNDIGGNGPLNVLLVQMSVYAIVTFLHKSHSFVYMSIVLGLSLYIAALAELKVTFFLLALVVVLSIFISPKSSRTVSLIMFGVVGVASSIALFLYLYPNWEGIFELDNLLKYSKEVDYGGTGFGINRTDGISTMYNVFLYDLPRKLFGIGMGGGDYSSYFASHFYIENGRYLYTWFSSAWMILENGILGLMLYVGFFGSVAVQSLIKYFSNRNRLFASISFITSIMAVLYMMYNQSLRVEIAYVIFFYLTFAVVNDSKDYRVLLNKRT